MYGAFSKQKCHMIHMGIIKNNKNINEVSVPISCTARNSGHCFGS
jgi:hypothetical protein